MIATSFHGTNLNLTKPIGTKDEDCFDLPAHFGIDEAGLPYFATAWKCSVEDLAALKMGGKVYLQQHGLCYQPISLHALNEEQLEILWPCKFIRHDKGTMFLIEWKPSELQLKALVEGGLIWMKTIGEHFQPIAVFTLDENNISNDAA